MGIKIVILTLCFIHTLLVTPLLSAPKNGPSEDENWRKSSVDPTKVLLANSTECRDDVKRLCPVNLSEDDHDLQKKVLHNFEILDCFLSLPGDNMPTESCQHLVFQYRKGLTLDPRFETAAKDVCGNFIKKHELQNHLDGLPAEHGLLLSYLMEMASYFKEEGTEDAPCYKFLEKMERVVFSDFHLIYNFVSDCEADLQKTKCGRIGIPDNEEDMSPHNQGQTIRCLMNSTRTLSRSCKLQIFRIAELQSDDYHLDRPLFFACSSARESLCKNVQSGGGKVYQCLIDNKEDPKVSKECRALLITREQMMQQDVKVNRGLYEECRDAFEKHGCMEKANPDDHHVQAMSDVLVCMMHKEMEDGASMEVSESCQKEIQNFQSEVMNDYRISPIIVADCKSEIMTCGGFEKATKPGEMLHCLMGLAKADERTQRGDTHQISSTCKASLAATIQEADPGKDLGIDKYLMTLCNSAVQEHCANAESKIECLMEQIENGELDQTDECASHLLELEYFITRNYRLDHKLVKACKTVIKDYGLQHDLKSNEKGPEAEGFVFGQLWKHVHDQVFKRLEPAHGKEPISNPCIEEVLRVVHERAVNIDLNPELEGACLRELSQHCSSVKPGTEVDCLEKNFQQISDVSSSSDCTAAIKRFIMDADQDLNLDYILMKSCEPSLKEYCGQIMKDLEKGKVDDGSLIQCLIEHKFEENMNEKCFTGIVHHQLINTPDFEFSAKFRESCKEDFKKIPECSKSKTKVEVVHCLSGAVRNDTLTDASHRVSDECRIQLQFELLAHEDAATDIDQEFIDKCTNDLQNLLKENLCQQSEKTQDGFMHCLRMHSEKLSKPCKKYVFKLAKEEKEVVGANSHIIRACKVDIKEHCMKERRTPERLIDCLEKNFDDLETQCADALDMEEEEENTDYRLNMALQAMCGGDVKEICAHEFNKPGEGEEMEGRIIQCLKKEYLKGTKSRLSDTCQNQMHLIVVRVHERDYKQDVVLTKACQVHVDKCVKEVGKNLNHGSPGKEDAVILCLKEKLFKGKLKDDAQCQNEVFRLVAENRMDIQTDRELYAVCSLEISQSACSAVPHGSGRVMSCLLSLHDQGQIKDNDCNKLVSERKQLWSTAAKLEPARDFSELFSDINNSSSRTYFITVIACVLLVILVLGVFCGRASKRVAAEIKNK